MASALSEPDGAGLGTLGLPPSKAEAMARQAGFTRFRKLDIEHPIMLAGMGGVSGGGASGTGSGGAPMNNGTGGNGSGGATGTGSAGATGSGGNASTGRSSSGCTVAADQPAPRGLRSFGQRTERDEHRSICQQQRSALFGSERESIQVTDRDRGGIVCAG